MSPSELRKLELIRGLVMHNYLTVKESINDDEDDAEGHIDEKGVEFIFFIRERHVRLFYEHLGMTQGFLQKDTVPNLVHVTQMLIAMMSMNCMSKMSNQLANNLGMLITTSAV